MKLMPKPNKAPNKAKIVKKVLWPKLSAKKISAVQKAVEAAAADMKGKTLARYVADVSANLAYLANGVVSGKKPDAKAVREAKLILDYYNNEESDE